MEIREINPANAARDLTPTCERHSSQRTRHHIYTGPDLHKIDSNEEGTIQTRNSTALLLNYVRNSLGQITRGSSISTIDKTASKTSIENISVRDAYAAQSTIMM